MGFEMRWEMVNGSITFETDQDEKKTTVKISGPKNDFKMEYDSYLEALHSVCAHILAADEYGRRTKENDPPIVDPFFSRIRWTMT